MAAPGATNIVIKTAEDGDFVTLEDGFFYFWPSKPGAYSAHHLRELATALDKMNADWQKQIDNDPSI